MLKKIDLCIVTGKEDKIIENHPKSIVRGANQAKLISANNPQNYIGRFLDSEQAGSISAIASHKIHSFLSWIYERQGISIGKQYLVCWSLNNLSIDPTFLKNIFNDSTDIVGEALNTNELFSDSLKKAIKGYNVSFENNENYINVFMIDALTDGRLSVVLDTVITESKFVENIVKWHDSMYWKQFSVKFIDDKYKAFEFLGSPSVKDIVHCAFGEKISDGVFKNKSTQLYKNILFGNKLSELFVTSAYDQVINPLSFKNDDNQFFERKWMSSLCITCSLIKNFYKERNYSMSIDETNLSRDYLFGRAMAIIEKIENIYLKKIDKKRCTKIIKLFNTFSVHPASTYANIIKDQQHLWDDAFINSSYFPRYEYLKNLLGKIVSNINTGFNDKKLSPEFLIGYYCQKNSFYNSQSSKQHTNPTTTTTTTTTT